MGSSPATWTHYAIVCDGASYTLYSNGVVFHFEPLTVFPASPSSCQFAIGQTGFSSGYEDWFNGFIDEFTIYNRALASNEIAAIYDAGSAGKCKTFPLVLSTFPTNNASQIAANATITATFSKPMDSSTINSNTFFLRDFNNNSVAGTVSYNSTNLTASLIPIQPLATNAAYVATITTGARGTNGSALPGNYSWQFATPGSLTFILNNTTIDATVTNFDGENLFIANAAVTITGGTHPFNSITVSGSGSLILNGGAVRGASMATTNGASFVVSGGTLDGVTVNGNWDVGSSVNGAQLTVLDGLTVNGTLQVGNPTNGWYGLLNFGGTQTLGGSGTVVFGNNTYSCGSYYNALRLLNGGTTLTIGAGLTVRGQNGTIGYQPCFGGPQNVSVINQGDISCDVNGGTIFVNAQPLVNNGSVAMSNGGSLNINYMTSLAGLVVSGNGTLTLNGTWQNSGPLIAAALSLNGSWTNSGTISAATLSLGGSWTNAGTINATGGTLTLNGNWINSGTINATNATVSLGGTFTLANLGVFNQSGSTVNLTGTLDNTNTTLVLNAATGSWVLNGGTVQGGAITASSGTPLIVSSGTFDGVTVDGVLDVGNSVNDAELTVTNGLILDGVALVGNPTNGWFGQISFLGDQTLGGNGTLVFGYGYLVYGASTLTLGSGITVHGANGDIGGNGSVVNLGTISADVAFGDIAIYTQLFSNQGVVQAINDANLSIYAQPFNNQGLVQAINGANLNISAQPFNNQGLAQAINGGSLWIDTLQNSASGTVVVNGGTLTLDGGNGSWTNAGTIDATNATVFLGGTLTTVGNTLGNLGNFDPSGATVYLTGLVNNTNMTLVLNAASNSWVLEGGTILGGSVTTTNGLALVVDYGTLDGVTVSGVLDVGNTYDLANLTVTNGLTLNGTALVGSPTNNSYVGGIGFAGSQTLGGNGTVLLSGNGTDGDYEALVLLYGGTTLTVGSGITLGGQTATIGRAGSPWDSPANVSVINQGTISADVALGIITINGQGFTDQGSLTVSAGATLIVNASVTFNDPGALSLQAGGTLWLGGDLLGNTRNVDQWLPQGTLFFTSGAHQMEAMSSDLGNVPNGYVHNFAYGTIALASGAQVTLVDESTNSAEPPPECVYTASLIVPGGSTLNLNGLHLYASLTQIGGTITNGTISQVTNNGAALVFSTSTPGTLSAAGTSNEFTFFGRAGQQVTVVVDPGSGNVPPPKLNCAEVQLLDPSTNLLGQTNNSVAGAPVVLISAGLPTDGTYQIRVRAPVNQPASAGNFLLTVWDSTPEVSSLVINQPASGHISTPYSVDQWNFSAAAGQQVTFELLNSSARGVAFNLTGPHGWVGFSNLAASSGFVGLPSTGGYTVTAFSLGGQYDIGFAFQLVQTVETNITLGTAFTGQLVGSGQAQLFEVIITNNNPMRISLSLGSAGGQDELYAKLGSPPTPSEYDYSYQGVAAQTEDIIIPSASQGIWYILIYGDYVPQLTLYSLQVIQNRLILESFAPSTAGSGVNTILSLSGAGFDSNTVVQLTSAGGSNVMAQSVNAASAIEMSAFFAPNTIPPGVYTVCVSSSAGTQCLTNLLTVILGGAPNFQASFVVPSVLGFHQPATIYVNYANTGTAPMPAPLLLLTGTESNQPGPILTLEASNQSAIGSIEQKLLSNFSSGVTNAPPGFTTTAQILASGSVPGLLQPGESYRFLFTTLVGWNRGIFLVHRLFLHWVFTQ